MNYWKLLLLIVICMNWTFGKTQQVELTIYSNGFTSPVCIENAGDSRLFIAEKAGIIKVINSSGVTNGVPFLDISTLVNSLGNEQGLLGLAFHPNYAANGFFYVNYTSANGSTQISRFSVNTLDPNLAVSTSEFQLLNIPQPYANNNGGDLNFGNDGYLYISLGDGGGLGDPAGNAQNINEMLGSILRIDIDNGVPYGIPPTNPFSGGGGAAEIWAWGLRNPWRFSFDKINGDLYIGDVGTSDWEEINLGVSNGNFGWNCFEGSAPYAGGCPPITSIAPIHEYAHSFGRCAVTGGLIYRGVVHPELYGHYIFGDYCSGEIFTMYNNTGIWTVVNQGNLTINPSTFGEDNNGEILVADISNGTIYKISESTTSIDEKYKNGVIGVFPNPTSGNTTIKFQYSNGSVYNLELTDLSGNILKVIDGIVSQEVNLNMSTFDKGIYMFKISSEVKPIGQGRIIIN